MFLSAPTQPSLARNSRATQLPFGFHRRNNNKLPHRTKHEICHRRFWNAFGNASPHLKHSNNMTPNEKTSRRFLEPLLVQHLRRHNVGPSILFVNVIFVMKRLMFHDSQSPTASRPRHALQMSRCIASSIHVKAPHNIRDVPALVDLDTRTDILLLRMAHSTTADEVCVGATTAPSIR